jgi:hypothetical protein
MDEKSILNNGFGSPGDTTRTLTREFLKQKDTYESDNLSICRKILFARAIIYESMGLNILDKDLVERIIEKSGGQLPFIIMADIFVTNRLRGELLINILLQNLSLVIEVVIENYNSSVPLGDQLTNQSGFEIKVREFIKNELRSFQNI